MRILFQFKSVPGPITPDLQVLFIEDPKWRPATAEEANTFLLSKLFATENEEIPTSSGKGSKASVFAKEK